MTRKAKKKDLGRRSNRPASARKARPGGTEAAGTIWSGKRGARLEFVIFTLVAAATAAYVYLQSPNLREIDAFYHFRHASLYAHNGIFMKEFPWAVYSVISRFSADIWYGFHLLLAPFTFIPDPMWEIKAGGIFLFTMLLVVLYLALRRIEISYPFLWPFLLLGPFVWRMAVPRPQIASLASAALLFSFMLRGGVWGVFFSSLALTFFHLSFFWLALVVAVAVALVKIRTEKILEWRKLLAVMLGLAAGWLLRPNPMGAAKILYVQVFELFFARNEGLSFGVELNPLAPRVLFSVFTPFLILWLGVASISLAVILLRRVPLPARSRTLFWSSFALSLLFFGMVVLVAMRSADQWALFAILSTASGFTLFIDPKAAELKGSLTREGRIIAASIGSLVFVFLVWHSMGQYSLHMRISSLPPYRFQAAGEWLKEHARPGEIVFNAKWDNFSELFFWDPQNRYIGGMDPIFQYAYDPSLYWKAHHLGQGEAASHTWGTRNPTEANLEDTYTVLRRDFKASYVFIEKKPRDNAALYGYLRGDPRFILRFDDEWAAIFQLSEAAQGEEKR